jgi:phospholipid/cholesterol/gamma-HCH transport system ATP-binding protein
VIQVQNISKSFKETRVLTDITIDFLPGKINFIIGRSGQGKSVLLKCMVGLLEPDSGSILYDGVDFLNMDEDQHKAIRQEVGMLFQGAALFDSMTVEENVMFPLTMYSNLTYSEKLQKVNECLERVNLVGKNSLYPAELSGGMKKRTGIARAIIMNPKFLFVDEPNSGLDPETSIVIDNLIRNITYDLGSTTIVVSHDMNSVMEIGDNINFISGGRVEWQGDKHALLKAENEALNNFVFASEFMQEIKENLKGK